jgi:hypothetical protein
MTEKYSPQKHEEGTPEASSYARAITPGQEDATGFPAGKKGNSEPKKKIKSFTEHLDVSESIEYHLQNDIPLGELYRVGSEKYYQVFHEARMLWKEGVFDLTGANLWFVQSDIGYFVEHQGQMVPLDSPMVEEDEKEPELNKPKAGGPKKYYVYVKDPSSGNIKKVSWGDTTGLKIKLNDPEARKSFAARHKCDTKNDKTKPGYWACRMPYFAKQLGLSGGGSYFW